MGGLDRCREDRSRLKHHRGSALEAHHNDMGLMAVSFNSARESLHTCLIKKPPLRPMNIQFYFRYAAALAPFVTTVSMTSAAFAQFPPERVYTNLFLDNYLSAKLRFIPRAYLNCQPGKIMANYEIQRDPVGRGAARTVAKGNLFTSDCGRALDDGEGWLFKETWSANESLCEGRLQLIDKVWHFDKAVQGKDCLFTGKSYFIFTSSTES